MTFQQFGKNKAEHTHADEESIYEHGCGIWAMGLWAFTAIIFPTFLFQQIFVDTNLEKNRRNRHMDLAQSDPSGRCW